MALESATYIPQLVPTNPLTTDPIAQAAPHLQLLKQVLQNTFPNIGTVAAVTGTAASINAAASAFANGTITAIQPNGTVASAELDLLGLMNAGGTIVAGRVEMINTATSAQAGALTIKMTNSADASPVTALTLTSDGTLTATGPVNASSVRQAGNVLIPSGMIMLWSGSVASIPAGWLICDGTNGTPNLLNMFVIGAGTGSGGSTYTPSATGGSASISATTNTAGAHNHGGADASAGSHNHGGSDAGYSLQVGDLPAHNHSVSLNDPGHTHGSGAGNFLVDGGPAVLGAGSSQHLNATALTASASTGLTVNETTVGSGNAHAHGISSDGAHVHAISTDGNHSHTVTVANSLPPYYALCYVMKS